MKRYLYTIAAITAVTASTPALAQSETDSTMTQSVRLERDFSPVVQQKNKIDRQPAQQEVKQKKADATLADWQVEPVRSSQVGIVPAGQVIAEHKQEQSGYVSLSAGNYWNTDLKAGAHLDEFSVDAKGFFTKGNLKLPFPVLTDEGLSDKKWESSLLSGEILGTWSHACNNEAQVEAHLGAKGTAARTFNYQFLGLSTDTLSQVCDKTGKQRWGQILGDVSYETDQLKLALGYDFTHLTTPDSLPSDWTTNTIQFKGSYGWYDNANWQASLDLDLGGTFGKEKSYFTIHPTLHLSLIPDPEAWRRFYIDLGFGTRHEALMEVMNQLPIAFFTEEYKNTTDALDFHIGYEDNDEGYLRWGAELELGYTKDELCAEAVSADTTGFDGLYMKILQDDCFTYGIQGHVDYEYNRFFGAKANILFHGHSCDAAGLGQPHLKMNLHLLSNPGPVQMDLGLDMGFKREILYMGEMFDLGSDVDLNYSLLWQCNPDFKVFGSLHNILNRQYQLWPGVPAQGFNVHAGFTWVF